MVDGQGSILATTNGGATWNPQSASGVSGLTSVAFANASHGWAVGWGGTILATTDGGATWLTQDSGTDAYLGSVACTDADHAWTVGNGGTILATTTGGRPPVLTRLRPPRASPAPMPSGTTPR